MNRISVMLVLPIRSEKETSKIPHLTIGLIAINLIIWIFTNRVVSSEYKHLESIHQQLLEIEYQYAHILVRQDPDLLHNMTAENLHRTFLEKGVIPKGSEDYRNWIQLYQEFEEGKNSTLFHRWGFIPSQLNILKLILSMFLHGSFFHVFGNMLYLWIVGCNMEDDWGWPRFIGLYLLSGMAAGLIHAAYGSNMTTPCIGASGAVAGVMGAFLIQHFRTKIRFVYFFLLFLRPIWGTFRVWAGVVLPFWFLMEFLYAGSGVQTGTAHWAHVGGFAFGVIAVLVTKTMTTGQEEEGTKETRDSDHGQPHRPAFVRKVDPDWIHRLTPVPSMEDRDPESFVSHLNEIICHEPYNYPVRLQMARITYQNGHTDAAAVSYNHALDTLFEVGDLETAVKVYSEVARNQLISGLSEKNIFQLGNALEKEKHYRASVKLFGALIKHHPKGALRAKAAYRAYRILKYELNNDQLADKLQSFLSKQYPDFNDAQ
jgi:membrane associated rhomboid family serine protease